MCEKVQQMNCDVLMCCILNIIFWEKEVLVGAIKLGLCVYVENHNHKKVEC